ncbi:MAG: hypothetical protein IPG56_16115 [Caulobacteraceae bacterium]|nr:hypothetical protein [Caulobacteraceae bacterium]
MRTPILAAILLSSASAAAAQNVVAPPATPAPAANAPLDERAQWCDEYATWLMKCPTRHPPRKLRRRMCARRSASKSSSTPANSTRKTTSVTRAEADLAVETAQG